MAAQRAATLREAAARMDCVLSGSQGWWLREEATRIEAEACDAEVLTEQARSTLDHFDRVWANTSNNPPPTVGVSAELRKLIAALDSETGALR